MSKNGFRKGSYLKKVLSLLKRHRHTQITRSFILEDLGLKGAKNPDKLVSNYITGIRRAGYKIKTFRGKRGEEPKYLLLNEIPSPSPRERRKKVISIPAIMNAGSWSVVLKVASEQEAKKLAQSLRGLGQQPVVRMETEL